jgi:phosphatidylinositol alpha-1,6-mannosyltransferase
MFLLATETWRSDGGVQRYMRILCQILTQRGRGLITLLDDPGDRPIEHEGALCCGGGKWKFVLTLTRESWKRPQSAAIVGHTSLLPVVWVLRKLGMLGRYAVVLHGIEAWGRLPWPARAAAGAACAVVATTEYTAREFCYYNGIDLAKSAIIPLANSLTVAVSAKPPGDPLRLLAVTRMSRSDGYKGIEFVLEAVRTARKWGTNVTLEIIGDGDDRPRLEELAGRLRILDIVHFQGRTTDQTLRDTLSHSHVFVLPSKKEGFGLVYLEAMAAGLPCIAANYGGVPEVVEHGRDGFLVEYGDFRRMAFYLRVLAEAPKLYLDMSEAARRRAASFSLAAMQRSWEALAVRLESAVGVNVPVRPANNMTAPPPPARNPIFRGGHKRATAPDGRRNILRGT